MDTAVPQGPAAKEERPRLINASRSGAAQSWARVKTNKEGLLTAVKTLTVRKRRSAGAIKHLPQLRCP